MGTTGIVKFQFDDEMYEKFDKSSVQAAWKLMRKMEGFDILAQFDMCPIPNIEEADYFDLLSVFVERKESPLHKIKTLVNSNKKYKYIGKFRDVINLGTNDKTKIDKMVQLKVNDENNLGYLIHRVGEGDKGRKYRAYSLRIEEPQLLEFTLNLDDKVGIGIDSLYPGLEKARQILIISRVLCGKRITIQTITGPNDRNIKWHSKPYKPMVFNAIKVTLDNKGRFKSYTKVNRKDLQDEAHWPASGCRVPLECGVIKSLSTGHSYNVVKNIGKKSSSVEASKSLPTITWDD